MALEDGTEMDIEEEGGDEDVGYYDLTAEEDVATRETDTGGGAMDAGGGTTDAGGGATDAGGGTGEEVGGAKEEEEEEDSEEEDTGYCKYCKISFTNDDVSMGVVYDRRGGMKENGWNQGGACLGKKNMCFLSHTEKKNRK